MTDSIQLPTIIENLDFAKTANEVQLWSVIPYAVAAVITGEYYHIQ